MRNKKDIRKKTKWVIILFFIIVVFLIFLGIIRFGNPIHYFGQNLVVSISPTQKVINLTHGKSFDMDFYLGISKSFLCKAHCRQEFVDISEGEVIKVEYFDINSSTLKKRFSLKAPYTGSGQVYYSLKLSCETDESFLCPVKQYSNPSAIVLVEYGLGEEEAYLQKEQKLILNKQVSDFSRLKSLMQRLDYLSSFQQVIDDEISEKISSIKIDYSIVSTMFNISLSLWNEENYILLKEQLPIDMKNLTEISEEINNILVGRIMQYNKISENLRYSRENILQIYPFTGNKELIESFKKISYSFFAGNFSFQDMKAASDFIFLKSKSIKEEILKEKTLYYLSKIYRTKDIDYYNYFDTNISRTVELCQRFLSSNNSNITELSVEEDNEAIKFHNQKIISLNKDLEEANVYLTYFHAEGDVSECNNYIMEANSREDYLEKEFYLIRVYDACSKSVSAIKEYVVEKNLTISAPSQVPLFAKLNHINYLSSNLTLGNETFNKIISDCLKDYYELNETLASNFSIINADLNYYPVIEKIQVKEHLPICCVFGQCRHCCNRKECLEQPFSYPVIFVHGHMSNKRYSPEYSMSIFDKLQEALENDGYINAGVLLPNSEYGTYGIWGGSGNPITVKVTYYYDVYDDNGDLINLPSKNETIETYADRLNHIIEIVKHKTGKRRVNIIAHSMGGLVAREYVRKYGSSSVNKIILIATPNYGITGRVDKYCSFLGESTECEEMSVNSSFLKKLNSDVTKGDVYVIAGEGCGAGDGIVDLENALLNYSKNYVIKGRCTDALKTSLHSDLLDISLYPEVYEIIKSILNE